MQLLICRLSSRYEMATRINSRLIKIEDYFMKIIMYIWILALVISGCDGEGMKMDRKVAQQPTSLQ